MNYFDYTDILASLNWITRSHTVKKFEEEFALYLGVKHTIATSYGRTALYLGLRALDVQGREVIIPAFICTVVRHAVVLSGATPKFVDITYDTLSYNLDDLKKAISPKTKAIVLTHFFGRTAANLEEILSLGKENGIPIIEDCAHSLGAKHNGRKVGTFGDFSIFSLTKSTINYGGGVLATNDESIYLKARSIIEREHFSLKRRIVDFPITLAYGAEQMIDKLVFDRVGSSIFKWWLIKIPRYCLALRSFVITLLKSSLSLAKLFRKQSVIPAGKNNDEESTNTYSHPLAMNRLTAAMGISQLKKADYLNNKRKHIVESIVNKLHNSFNDRTDHFSIDANSFIVLRFKNSNIFKIVERCKRQGLLLRPTWPTHQKLWDGQDTPAVREIEKTVLTWTVNPMLTEREINKFAEIINSLPESREH